MSSHGLLILDKESGKVYVVYKEENKVLEAVSLASLLSKKTNKSEDILYLSRYAESQRIIGVGTRFFVIGVSPFLYNEAVRLSRGNPMR